MWELFQLLLEIKLFIQMLQRRMQQTNHPLRPDAFYFHVAKASLLIEATFA